MPREGQRWASLAAFLTDVGARGPAGLGQDWPAEDETRFIYPHLPCLWVLYHQYVLEVLYLWHYSDSAKDNLNDKAIPELHAEFKRALSNLHAQWGHGEKMVREGVCCHALMDFHNKLLGDCKSLLALLATPLDGSDRLVMAVTQADPLPVRKEAKLLAKLGPRKKGVQDLRHQVGWLPIPRMQIGSGTVTSTVTSATSTVQNASRPPSGPLPSEIPSPSNAPAHSGVAAADKAVGTPMPFGPRPQPEADEVDEADAPEAAVGGKLNDGDQISKYIVSGQLHQDFREAKEEVLGLAGSEAKEEVPAEGTGENDGTESEVAAPAQPDDENDMELLDNSQDDANVAEQIDAKQPAAVGRPKGSSNSKTFTKDQVRIMCEKRFSLICEPWEDSIKVSAKNLLQHFGGQRVSLFLNDAWFEDKEPYTSAYHLKLLRQQAKLATEDAVSVLNGSSQPIQALIAYYQGPKGKRALRQAGWDHVDPYSLEVVNIKGGGARNKGMGNRRESLLVCYMKRWNSKTSKAKYVANATDAAFWDCFPRKYKPDEAHRNNVLSNTFTGYRSASDFLKNPGTNTRVRPSAEKNPMLYLYLLRRFAYEPNSVVADFFGGTLSSVIAALYTDNRVLAFEKDADCANLAWERVVTTACKVTTRTRLPLGQCREAMTKLGAKKARKDHDDLFEYSYTKMMEVFYSLEYCSTLNLVQ